MIGRLLRRGRARFLKRQIDEERRFYERSWTREAVDRWQLDRFNQVWERLRASVPFYRTLFQDGRAPASFDSWEEVRQELPVTNRAVLQSRHGEFMDESKAPDRWMSTGGSTGQPLRIPLWSLEIRCRRPMPWYARSWFGIEPDDRLFLLWGHSHLLGTGWRRPVRQVLQRLKDWVFDYHRHSAYDLGQQAMKEAGRRLLDLSPAWILGYSGALERLARVNRDRGDDFADLDLKAVVATAESFTREGGRDLVERLFGAPVAMEYGAIETGVIAHERPNDDGYRVFWRRYRVEASEGRREEGHGTSVPVTVTALYPRCLPLVRYELGDLIVPPGDRTPVRGFAHVVGRRNDFVTTPDGRLVHSEAFGHALKEREEILDFRVLQRPSGHVVLQYVSRCPLDDWARRTVRDRLRDADESLHDVALERVPELPKTPAGKTRRFVRREEASA